MCLWSDLRGQLPGSGNGGGWVQAEPPFLMGGIVLMRLPPRRVIRINNLGLMSGLNVYGEIKKLPIAISLGYLGITHKLSIPKGPER